MTRTLAVASGINAAQVKVPEQWSATWFRRFIATHLANSDIRNATAGFGVSIVGDATSRATLSAAGALGSLPSDTVLGNNTASTAPPFALSQLQLTGLINVFNSSLSGAVPASGGGTTNFLRADGTWAVAGAASPLTTKGDIYAFDTANDRLPVGSDGYVLTADSTQAIGLSWKILGTPQVRGASFSAGTANLIVPTNNVPIYVPFGCTITNATLLTQGGTGSCQLDIWKVPYASYPPAIANSIVASAPPKITSGVTYTDSTLSGWTTALSTGDTLLVNLKSVSGFTEVTLYLTLTPNGFINNGYTNANAVAAVAAAATVTPITGVWTFQPATSTTAITVDSNGSGTSPDIYVTGNVNHGVYIEVQNTNSGSSATAELVLDNGTHQSAIEMLGVNNSEGEYLSLGTNSQGVRFGAAASVSVGFLTYISSVAKMTILGPVAGTQVDMTPDASTFTATYATGFTTTPTATYSWCRNGNQVTLFMAGLTATGGGASGTAWTITGLPAAIQPTRTFGVALPFAAVEDNSTIGQNGTAFFTASSGTITMVKGNSATGWTGSGTKGTTTGMVITYPLN